MNEIWSDDAITQSYKYRNGSQLRVVCLIYVKLKKKKFITEFKKMLIRDEGEKKMGIKSARCNWHTHLVVKHGLGQGNY